MREMLNDKWLQVRAFFAPGDATRELLSTVTRGWVLWQVILVLGFLGGCALSFSQSEWYQGFLQFMVAALFTLTAFYEMVLNVAKKRLDDLFAVCKDQQKTMRQMMDVIDPPAHTEEFD